MPPGKYIRTDSTLTGRGLTGNLLRVADNAITSTQLENISAGVAGSYATPGNITVDAQGRVTAIDNSNVGGGGGSGSPSYTTLTAGAGANVISLEVGYWGSSPPTLAETSGGTPGDYTLTEPTGTILKSAVFTGDDDNHPGMTFVIRIVSTDGAHRFFTPALLGGGTSGNYQPLAGAGIMQSMEHGTAGTVVATLINMSYATGFTAILNFV